MKFTKMIIVLVLMFALLGGASNAYGFLNNHHNVDVDVDVTVPVNVDVTGDSIGDIDNSQDQKQGQNQKQGQLQSQLQGQQQDASNRQGQSQINEGNTTTVTIDNSTDIPAPLQSLPNFVAPVDKTVLDISWTGSPYGTLLGQYSIPEMSRIANPSKALGFLWYEWTKSFQIEMACRTKAKRTLSLIILPADSNMPTGLTKIGEAHAKAIELHKSERQVTAALGVYATMQGANYMLVTSFSNPVTKTDSAVIGGAGASVTGDGTMINSAGGFGFATAEKVFRSYVVVELYR